ncbi:terpene synthase family protein [Kitasatospora sp. NPDC056138]|uniref:terpene synthase family protein n=1 Tax=Kitasatospora sp. NPDC056138 TaxID=3345724 RepID=UPI0035E1D228
MNLPAPGSVLAPADRSRSGRIPRTPEEFAAAVVRHTGWVVARGLLPPQDVPRYQVFALHELIGHSYPRARGAELDLLLDILGWFTILDDRFDGPTGHRPAEAHALIDPLLAVLPGPRSDLTAPDTAPDLPALGLPAAAPVTAAPDTAPDSALIAAWQDLWYRQAGPMTDSWRRRAAAEWRVCLTTFVTETRHRARGTLPDLSGTALLRRHASCLYPFMNMLERVHGAGAPAQLHAEPSLHRLRAQTADAATLINDLFSLEREERQSAAQFNMVMALQRTRGYRRDEAIAAVRTRVRRLQDDSDALRRQLVRRHPAGHWYLHGTRELVDGVYAWTSTSHRYHGH